MEISWVVDEFDTFVDPNDVLGKIVLQSDHEEIIDECVYLDDWFAVLIDGISALKQGEALSADLISEPSAVQFKCVNASTAQITYNKCSLTVSILELERSIQKSSRELLEFVKNCSAPNVSMEAWEYIVSFLQCE